MPNGFIPQVLSFRPVTGGDAQEMRVGFTCSKKVGNAVARNRAKRRLREIARLVLPKFGQVGHDYVLIGRANVTATTKFTALQEELLVCLAKAAQASHDDFCPYPRPARAVLPTIF